MENSDRWLAILLRTLLIGLFVWMVKGLLIPIAVGALFALLLHPVQRRVEHWLGKRKQHAPLVVTIGAVVLGVLPLLLVVQQAAKSATAFVTNDFPSTMERIEQFVAKRLGRYQQSFGISGEKLREGINLVVGEIGNALGGLAGGMARAVPATIISGFLFLIALYYFSRDGFKLARWTLRISPFSSHETHELFDSIKETVNGAILGLLATAAVQGGLTLAALFAFRVPGAFIFGIIAALLSFIPMIGTTPVTLGATIYLLAVGRTGAAIAMGILGVVIGLSDNVVRPWVQSAHTHVHPLVTLLGIFGGLEIFGASGIFIGPVVAAMAIWTVDAYTALRSKQKKRLTLPPPAPTPRNESANQLAIPPPAPTPLDDEVEPASGRTSDD